MKTNSRVTTTTTTTAVMWVWSEGDDTSWPDVTVACKQREQVFIFKITE